MKGEENEKQFAFNAFLIVFMSEIALLQVEISTEARVHYEK